MATSTVPLGVGFGVTDLKMAAEDDEIALGDSERDEFELLDDAGFLADACFNREFTSVRLPSILREYFAREGICSSIASSLIMSIKFAPFMSSPCNCENAGRKNLEDFSLI